jgi:hypothetical protein
VVGDPRGNSISTGSPNKLIKNIKIKQKPKINGSLKTYKYEALAAAIFGRSTNSLVRQMINMVWTGNQFLFRNFRFYRGPEAISYWRTYHQQGQASSFLVSTRKKFFKNFPVDSEESPRWMHPSRVQSETSLVEEEKPVLSLSHSLAL